ncbi:MAG: hypothetical protein IVW54_05410 [Candidatus Binataceae bacterium]|nr:hypothetical protein [Candidatus Binataceae bacterium]
MDAAGIAKFFTSIGNRVIRTESCYWYNPQPFMYRSLPIHRFVAPAPAEIAKVLMLGPALALRYPMRPDAEGAPGGMFVCHDRNYDFASLSQNVRSRTRRGLARCRIEQISFEYLAEHGYALTEETTLRQMGKKPNRSIEEWRLFCTNASHLADFEAWGAFVEDRLATFMVAMLVEDCYYIHLQKSASDLLKFYPNNALLFTVMKTKFACPEVGFISHGPKALAVGKGLEYYKTSMGLEIQPCTEQVVFNPLIKPFISWKGDAVVNRMVRRHPENLFWRRAARALSVARGEESGAQSGAEEIQAAESGSR